MPKITPLTRAELLSRREKLLQKVAEGHLRLPEGIREIRKALGLSQETFGTLFKLTRNQLIELEKGRANPTLDTLARIGKSFGFRVGFVPATPMPAAPAAADPTGSDSARKLDDETKIEP